MNTVPFSSKDGLPRRNFESNVQRLAGTRSWRAPGEARDPTTTDMYSMVAWILACRMTYASCVHSSLYKHDTSWLGNIYFGEAQPPRHGVVDSMQCNMFGTCFGNLFFSRIEPITESAPGSPRHLRQNYGACKLRSVHAWVC